MKIEKAVAVVVILTYSYIKFLALSVNNCYGNAVIRWKANAFTGKCELGDCNIHC